MEKQLCATRGWLTVCTALLLCIPDASLAATVYRCTQRDGSVTLSDKECPQTGARRAGIEWVDVEQDRAAREAEQQRRIAQRDADRLAAERRQKLIDDKTAADALAKAQRARGVGPEASLDRAAARGAIIGRGQACGASTTRAVAQLETWIDSFADNSAFRNQLRNRAEAAATMFKAMQNADTKTGKCTDVVRTLQALPPM
jgi:hypothetical protein